MLCNVCFKIVHINERKCELLIHPYLWLRSRLVDGLGGTYHDQQVLYHCCIWRYNSLQHGGISNHGSVRYLLLNVAFDLHALVIAIFQRISLLQMYLFQCMLITHQHISSLTFIELFVNLHWSPCNNYGK